MIAELVVTAYLLLAIGGIVVESVVRSVSSLDRENTAPDTSKPASLRMINNYQGATLILRKLSGACRIGVGYIKQPDKKFFAGGIRVPPSGSVDVDAHIGDVFIAALNNSGRLSSTAPPKVLKGRYAIVEPFSPGFHGLMG